VSSLLFVPPPALAAAPQETALFGGGDPIFLEYVFDNLRYAGVSDVVVGVADGVRCVLVTFNPQRIKYLLLSSPAPLSLVRPSLWYAPLSLRAVYLHWRALFRACSAARSCRQRCWTRR